MARQTAVTGGGARTTSQQAGVVSPRSPRRATSFLRPKGSTAGLLGRHHDAGCPSTSPFSRSGFRVAGDDLGRRALRQRPLRPGHPTTGRVQAAQPHRRSCGAATSSRVEAARIVGTDSALSRERAMREHALARRCWIRLRSRRRTLTNAAAKQMREPLVLSPLAIPDLLTPPLDRVCKLGGSPVRAPHAPSPKHDRVDSSGRKLTLNPHG